MLLLNFSKGEYQFPAVEVKSFQDLKLPSLKNRSNFPYILIKKFNFVFVGCKIGYFFLRKTKITYVIGDLLDK